MFLKNSLNRTARAALALITGVSLSLATPSASADDSFGAKLISRAMDLVGVKYRFGGTSPTTGLDCSGYVQYVFQNAVGIALPRVASAQSQVGERVSGLSDARPGDMVFFNTRGFAASHVGIYLGNGMFIHSPRSGSSVRVDSIENPYWKARFTSARRVQGAANSITSNAPRGM